MGKQQIRPIQALMIMMEETEQWLKSHTNILLSFLSNPHQKKSHID